MTRWKKTLAVLLTAAAVFAATVVGGFTYLVYLIHGRDHVSDQHLVDNLARDKNKYEQLIRMFRDDAPIRVVHPTFVEPVGIISSERWDKYKALFEELQLDAGMRSWEGKEIWFISTAQGLVTGGSSKGYMYQPVLAKPEFHSLDRIPADLPSNVRGYRKIDEDWYITIDWSQ